MRIKIIYIGLLIFALSINGYAQTVHGYRKPINEKAVPKIVLKTYYEQYPGAFLLGWYSTHISYWQNDYSSGWYYDWYGNRSIVIYKYENPNYYEVEFFDDDGNNCRSIYDLYGYWYETRTKIKELPYPIVNHLKNSKYSNWETSPLMEKIKSSRWPTVYRFNVYNGKKSKILRMDIEGTIIQAKYVSE
ncbi:hypothetical protein ACFL5D_00415 [Candidatus Neomarinimicrobiota bacterium]